MQHEWLFGVGVYAVEWAFGLYGLRALHLVALLGIGLGVYATLRRAASSAAFAALASAVFLALAWWRLAQLRPDLASIAAALATTALVLAPSAPPSWRRVAGFAALCALWANLHSLAMVGLALVVAALLGLALEGVLARACPADPERPRRLARARRLAAALGLGALAALANPRGVAQHLTFLHSSRETAVWQVQDEWVHFDPLSWRAGGYAENPVAWALTDALLLAFAAAGALALWRFARERSPERLRAFDAVGFGLGVAAFFSIFVSIRFRWLAFLPLLYVLRAAGRLPRARGAGAAWLAAGATACLAAALALRGDTERWTGLLPRAPGEYLARSHVAGKYHAEGVRFLAAAGLEGRLFNHYWMGGYLGHWLAPRLRTFVDGRTEHYAPDVLSDAQAISGRSGALPGEASHLDVLERRKVDVFFGVGLPPFAVGPGVGVYTADNLAGEPSFVLVFRAVDQALYVRRAGGAENLARAARFYREQGVPFDPEHGLDPDRVLREAPAFARAWRLAPRDEEALLLAAATQAAAGETLAQGYCAAGAWSAALAASQQVLSLDTMSKSARRCVVYVKLRTGLPDQALEEALALQRLDPVDARSRRALGIARRAAGGASSRELGSLLLRYPLLDGPETAALLAHYASTSLQRTSRSGAIEVWP